MFSSKPRVYSKTTSFHETADTHHHCKRMTDRFPEAKGKAFRKLFALAGSHTEDNSLFPVALHPTGGLGFWFVGFFLPSVHISGSSCMGNSWTQSFFQGSED